MSDRNVVTQWKSIERLPFGRWLFSKMIGITVPYAASINARVDALTEGHAQVHMSDRRSIRNHLKSIHAIALTHLAELTANLALMTRQTAQGRWIVTSMETTYVKKARGTIRAEVKLPKIDWKNHQEVVGSIELRDQKNEIGLCRIKDFLKQITVDFVEDFYLKNP